MDTQREPGAENVGCDKLSPLYVYNNECIEVISVDLILMTISCSLMHIP